MPSNVHAAMVEVLEQHPEALEYLLSLAGYRVEGPLVTAPETQAPMVSLERRLDRVFLLGEASSPEGFALVEVQLSVDPDKRFSWPLCMEIARSRFRCEGALVVLTIHPKLRRWIERTIVPATGRWGSSRQLSPMVIALDEIAPARLLREDRPYLARLAVAAHRDRREVVEEALRMSVEHLPERLAPAQIDAILGMIDAALRRELENELMQKVKWKSETFRRWEAEATAKGLAEGKAEGLAEGKAEGKAEAILQVLAARGVPVRREVREQVLACHDVETLGTWLARAVVATSADEVVRPARRKRAGTARRAKDAG